MERLLTWIALAAACTVALLLPGITAFSGYTSLRSILGTEAEINGRLVTQLVSANPELWRVETLRLEELLKRRPGDKTAERRAVLELDGTVVSEVSDVLPRPHLEARTPVYDAGQAVAQLTVRRSLRPLLIQVAWFGAFGALLGWCIYLTLKLLPLAALKRAQQQLVHEATHDALTGLPNRTLFLQRLDEAMRRAQRSRRPLALMFMDLDHFKDVNDSRGHQVGDQVLCNVAALLLDCLCSPGSHARRADDGRFTIARLGGDEFTVLVESAGSVEETTALAGHILARLAQPQRIDGSDIFVSGSIGIALYPQDNTDRDTLLRQADMAMYQAKDAGRNTLHFFNDALNRSIQQRIRLDQDLRGALERGEFVLHYQPKADLMHGTVCGVEALLRWQRPGEGLVPPDRFIGVLEASRLIIPVGAWVIATACKQLTVWDAAGLPLVSLAVNLSARQFRDPDLALCIETALAHTGIAAHRLELELTESLLMEDNALSRDVLARLARIGVRVAIDDFGTGHSSLSYLKRFKVNTLKIDKSFVREVPHDPDNCAIATAVVALARSMKLSVVCEGVETLEQVDFMRTLGCDAIQGFLLGRPMDAAALSDWLRRYDRGDPDLTAWSRPRGAMLAPPLLTAAPQETVH
jgi:diguanylate cyclase (GGDEF)-like protein